MTTKALLLAALALVTGVLGTHVASRLSGSGTPEIAIFEMAVAAREACPEESERTPAAVTGRATAGVAVSPRYTTITILANSESTAGSARRTDSRVNVIGTEADGSGSWKTLVEGARVLAIETIRDDSGDAMPKNSVTLGVEPEDVEKIKLAQQTGRVFLVPMSSSTVDVASLVRGSETPAAAPPLPEGLRPVAVYPGLITSVGGELVNSRVTVVNVTRTATGGFESTTLLQRVLVLAFDSQRDDAGRFRNVVTLALTPAESAKLEEAKAAGTLRLVQE